MKIRYPLYISLGVILVGVFTMLISILSQIGQINDHSEEIGRLNEKISRLDKDISELDGKIRQPGIEVARTTVIAYTADQTPPAWWRDYPLFEVPALPAPGIDFDIGDRLRCQVGYLPVTAWTEVVVSLPADVMYSKRVLVTDGGSVVINLRARQSGRGYNYIEVMLLCRRDHSAS